jgi:hypothetical protein
VQLVLLLCLQHELLLLMALLWWLLQACQAQQ